MPDTYIVTPTAVRKNGAAITGLIGFRVELAVDNESNAFTAFSLVMKIKDAPSDTARTGAVATLTTAEKALLTTENTIRPTTREAHSLPGDTVKIANDTAGTVVFSQTQSASWSAADEGGGVTI